MNLNPQQLGGGVGASPIQIARHGGRQYQRANGLRILETHPNRTVVDLTAIKHVAATYNALPDHDPAAVPAFRALAEETKRQFEHLTRPVHKGGMGFDVNVSREDPYDTSKPGGTRELFNDIANRKVTVLSTATTGGHPVFSNDENNMFRAVHDVFGHAGTGRGVDRHGEEAAYRRHATMFSPLARQALASETRGQNHAMINAGGQFQDQKIVIMPAHVRRFAFVAPRTADALHTSMTQARQFHQNQGLDR
jgi:hypothetical protein